MRSITGGTMRSTTLAAAECQVERPYLRATWLCGVVLFLEGYDIAAAGYVVPSLVDVWRVDPSVFTEALAAGLSEFEIYIRNNRDFIPNFGERYRQGETISTAFVESTINQVVSRRFVKKQSMQWTLRGAHLLLQTRTKVLNKELEDVFRRWYPQFRREDKAVA
jgi:hypothetical protein